MQLLSIEAVVNRGRIYASTGVVELYDAVCLAPGVDGAVQQADASVAQRQKVVGIVTHVFADTRVLVEGRTGLLVTNPAWTWTRKDRLYLAAGSPGALVAVAPAPGAVQLVAEAMSATQIVLQLTDVVL